jgi:hypothetical protein
MIKGAMEDFRVTFAESPLKGLSTIYHFRGAGG